METTDNADRVADRVRSLKSKPYRYGRLIYDDGEIGQWVSCGNVTHSEAAKGAVIERLGKQADFHRTFRVQTEDELDGSKGDFTVEVSIQYTVLAHRGDSNGE